MRFRVTFYGPFRVATGAAKDGLDDVFDPVNPLPASSLKGLMRANAQTLLRIRDDLIEDVYGAARRRSPWWWSDVTLSEASGSIRTRLAIDPDTNTARRGALITAAELWADEGWFEIRHRDPLDPERLELHQAVLTASALAITSLGSDRRRGSGWVGVTAERAWDDKQHELLRAHRRNNA